MKELITLLELTNAEIFSYLKKNYFGDYVTDGDNYLYKDNGSALLMVAHMDTVVNDHLKGKKAGKVEVEVHRNILTNKHAHPLGADDRSGIYGILEILRGCKEAGLPLPSVLITNHEECGGKGVKAFVRQGILKTEDLHLMIELDRRGCNEWVTYSDLPTEVEQYIEGFGFIDKFGSYSDISDLSDEYLIPSVNLSIGYYDQHTTKESQHFDELMFTVDRVLDMIASPIGELHACAPAVVYPVYARGDWGGWDGHGYGGQVCDFPAKKKASKMPEVELYPGWTADDVYFLTEMFWEFIDLNTTAGRECLLCNDLWFNCECGDMLRCFVDEFHADELNVILEENLVSLIDPLYPYLQDILEQLEDEDIEELKEVVH